VEFIADDVRGVAVHATARVLSVANPSEVVVSDMTMGLLEGSGLSFEDAGVHSLKGLSGQRQLFRLTKT
jgi:class 3 adenylate cyclase